jgi:hypothetical protein
MRKDNINIHPKMFVMIKSHDTHKEFSTVTDNDKCSAGVEEG